MKIAKIGTIMPWCGNGNDGFLVSNVPKGWILCNGTSYNASRFPLLASVLGDTYGGTNFSGAFPDYNGTFAVPNMTGKCPMDLEPYMLTDQKYQYGQSDASTVLGTKVLNYGLTTPIQTLISANADINFTVDSTLIFTGKMTNITITDPDFNTTIYTANRKLGINHMPGHSHPGTYSQAVAESSGPMIFEPMAVQQSGSVNGTVCPQYSGNNIECQLRDIARAATWQNGSAFMTYFADETREHTLVTTDIFRSFDNAANKDYTKVPATVWPTSLNSDVAGGTYTTSFSSAPVKTHQMDAWSGMFPRPGQYANRRNFFGFNTGFTNSSTGLVDDPEQVPVKTYTVSIPAGATKFNLAAGANIGTYFNDIRPYMWVYSASIAPGTQVLGINRISGTSSANYVYEIELSQSTANVTTSTETVTFRNGTYPTTLNTLAAGQDPDGAVFTGHNHASFEVGMSKGSLTGPATHPVTNISIGDVVPENINDALNIIADIQAPSLSITYIIRAY
jgi:hypothetical protein